MKGIGYMNTTEQIKKQAIHVSLKLGETANDYKKKLVQVMNNNYYDESQVLSLLVSLGQTAETSLTIVDLLSEDSEVNKKYLYSFVNNLGGK